MGVLFSSWVGIGFKVEGFVVSCVAVCCSVLGGICLVHGWVLGLVSRV